MASVMKNRRITLDDLELSPGKHVRLQRLLYGYGPGNGTMMLLPVDHGMEHGPVDFFDNPAALDPDYIWRLALEGGFSGVALQYGTALKYMRPYAGRMPLVLKLNGKTNIPPDDDPLNPLNATVEDAVRLGADAIGYTLYMGSSRQDEDFAQWRQVRQDADRFGMPTIMWAYPRGRHMEAKGGRDSFYAIDYAARVACELGADVVKINVPKIDPEKDKLSPTPYNTMKVTPDEALAKGGAVGRQNPGTGLRQRARQRRGSLREGPPRCAVRCYRFHLRTQLLPTALGRRTRLGAAHARHVAYGSIGVTGHSSNPIARSLTVLFGEAREPLCLQHMTVRPEPVEG